MPNPSPIKPVGRSQPVSADFSGLPLRCLQRSSVGISPSGPDGKAQHVTYYQPFQFI